MSVFDLNSFPYEVVDKPVYSYRTTSNSYDGEVVIRYLRNYTSAVWLNAPRVASGVKYFLREYWIEEQETPYYLYEVVTGKDDVTTTVPVFHAALQGEMIIATAGAQIMSTELPRVKVTREFLCGATTLVGCMEETICSSWFFDPLYGLQPANFLCKATDGDIHMRNRFLWSPYWTYRLPLLGSNPVETGEIVVSDPGNKYAVLERSPSPHNWSDIYYVNTVVEVDEASSVGVAEMRFEDDEDVTTEQPSEEQQSSEGPGTVSPVRVIVLHAQPNESSKSYREFLRSSYKKLPVGTDRVIIRLVGSSTPLDIWVSEVSFHQLSVEAQVNLLLLDPSSFYWRGKIYDDSVFTPAVESIPQVDMLEAYLRAPLKLPKLDMDTSMRNRARAYSALRILNIRQMATLEMAVIENDSSNLDSVLWDATSRAVVVGAGRFNFSEEEFETFLKIFQSLYT